MSLRLLARNLARLRLVARPVIIVNAHCNRSLRFALLPLMLQRATQTAPKSLNQEMNTSPSICRKKHLRRTISSH